MSNLINFEQTAFEMNQKIFYQRKVSVPQSIARERRIRGFGYLKISQSIQIILKGYENPCTQTLRL